MAIVFARPTLFSTLRARLLTTRAGAPPNQGAKIVRPFNPFGIYRPPFAPVTLPKPPDVRPRPEVMIAPPVTPVVIAAPAPAPVEVVKETCQTCKGEAAPAPAPAAPAPELSLTTNEAPEAPTPAATETPAPAAAAPRKTSGLLIAAGVILALLAFASYIRPRS